MCGPVSNTGFAKVGFALVLDQQADTWAGGGLPAACHSRRQSNVSTRLPKRRRHPHKPTLLRREAARNLAHVVKIVSHHDTAACIFSSCCRNVSTVARAAIGSAGG